MRHRRAPMIWDAQVIAILQSLVIVGAFLTARDFESKRQSLSIPLPWYSAFLADFGCLLLVIPVAWLSWVVYVRRSPNISRTAGTVSSATGFMLSIILILFVGCALIGPFLKREIGDRFYLLHF